MFVLSEIASFTQTDWFQELPVEYNSWLLFRQVVDIILIKYAFSYQFRSRAHSLLAISYPTACSHSRASVFRTVCPPSRT